MKTATTGAEAIPGQATMKTATAGNTTTDAQNGPASVPPPSLASNTPKEGDLLLPSSEEAARYQETQRPDYEPPPPEPRPLPEKVERAAKAANTLLQEGKNRVLAREVGRVLENFGWKPRDSSNNGVGDVLGEQGLKLKAINSPKGRLYEIPKTGITKSYLRGIGFDV